MGCLWGVDGVCGLSMGCWGSLWGLWALWGVVGSLWGAVGSLWGAVGSLWGVWALWGQWDVLFYGAELRPARGWDAGGSGRSGGAEPRRASMEPAELFGAVEPIVEELRDAGVAVWVMGAAGSAAGGEELNEASEAAPAELRAEDVWKPPDMGETALYIFTSGTTGGGRDGGRLWGWGGQLWGWGVGYGAGGSGVGCGAGGSAVGLGGRGSAVGMGRSAVGLWGWLWGWGSAVGMGGLAVELGGMLWGWGGLLRGWGADCGAGGSAVGLGVCCGDGGVC